MVCLRWTPHPVIVTTRDNKDCIRVLVYSYYTTITGWGVLLRYVSKGSSLGANPQLSSAGLLLLHIGVSWTLKVGKRMAQHPKICSQKAMILYTLGVEASRERRNGKEQGSYCSGFGA